MRRFIAAVALGLALTACSSPEAPEVAAKTVTKTPAPAKACAELQAELTEVIEGMISLIDNEVTDTPEGRKVANALDLESTRITNKQEKLGC